MQMEDILKAKYDEHNFILFSRDFLKDIRAVNGKLEMYSQFNGYIEEGKIIADFTDINNKKIAILSVKVHNDSSARTAQRNYIAKLLSNGSLQGYDAALVAFYDNIRSNWKLALVTIDFALTEKGIDVEFQPAKRFSFLVGEGEPSKTYVGQLKPIFESTEKPTYEQIKDAFSINRVTKDFYNDYCDCFEKLSTYLMKCRAFKDEAIRLQYDEVKEFAITFTKKTLGQIVFLHFIQKKGWLGVKPTNEWGTGNKNYIYDSTVNYIGDNYFNDVLEPLFYEALNKKRENYLYLGDKIPFLNGGLFSPLENYRWKETNFAIPNDIWFNSKHTGFLDILSQYNFTVDESDPTEQDIAVDPEMLGKIFESLLDPEERHDNGAHYTPREIVHFMCIESLAYNVSTKFNLEFTDVKNYILYGNSLENKIEIKEKAKLIFEYLKNIRIVDPAVGSGAFLVGMLNEILKLRINLAELEGIKYSKYGLKKEAIQNSLFGVDIEYDAIEIAKLRLWLSLIVDQEVEKNSCPNPLPNLSFQLRVGNSLIDEYHGIKLWDKSLFKKKTKTSQYYQVNLFNVMDFDAILNNLKRAKEEYFSISDEREKTRVFEEISRYQLELIKNVLFNQGEQHAFYEVEEMIKRRTKPFFLWKLEFDKVFDEGGFDIVIANPPYIQLQNNEGKLANELEPQGFKTFSRMGDIYCLFYEQATNLLKENGIFSFITSNKWMRASYGEPLRKFLAEKTNPLLLVDLGGTKVFESATVDVNILVASKQKNKGKTKTLILDDKCTNDLSILVEQDKNFDSYNDSSNWTILTSIEKSIKTKIQSVSVKLEDINVKINYGIKTGANEVFIIDENLRNKLISKDPRNDEIIRPLIRGRDVKRFKIEYPGLYLLNIHNGIPGQLAPIDIDDYPVVKNFMTQYINKLKKRKDQGITAYNLRSCSYLDDFLKQKLVYTPVNSEYRFALVPSNIYFPNSLFMITGENIEFLCGIFNSKLYRFFLYIMFSNGKYTYGSSSFFLSMPVIKNVDNISLNRIVQLVKKLSNEYDEKLYENLNEEIYKIYDISIEEINYIENIIKN